MFRSINKLSTHLNNRYVMGTLSRGIAEQRSSMEEYFKDKSFIVTGASAGMGKVITGRLLAMEAHVFAIGRDIDSLPSIPDLKLTKVNVDIGDWDSTYKKILEMGPVHGLVNNAGVAHIEPFMETTQHGWDEYECRLTYIDEKRKLGTTATITATCTKQIRQ